ncbi:MAG TPA: NAD(P)H-dependent oxidoreductase [Kofleriaceae bacterium]|nr:NAD(P)H-dependent oxidoreductase [Kofleriaceae bacterium]
MTLAHVAAHQRGRGASVDLASMRHFDCPSHDGDREAAECMPAGAAELQRRLAANDAFAIVSPEYNAAMPVILENAIDYSRFRPQPFDSRRGAGRARRPSRWKHRRACDRVRLPGSGKHKFFQFTNLAGCTDLTSGSYWPTATNPIVERTYRDPGDVLIAGGPNVLSLARQTARTSSTAVPHTEPSMRSRRTATNHCSRSRRSGRHHSLLARDAVSGQDVARCRAS